MSKITLTDLANLSNQTTAVNAINSNNAVLEAAIDNTLSRDGTAPNQMGANLDMNSNRILNLPGPVNSAEPLRLTDLNNFIGGGTITNIPAGGATGNLLTKTSNVDYAVGWAPPAVNIPLASLASQAASTLVGNPSASPTSPSAFAVGSLTQKVSPANTDLIMIQDQAASGALKYALVSSIAAGSGVSSIAGNIGVFTLSTGITNSANDIRLALNNATLMAAPATPGVINSAAAVMAGLGVSVVRITPVYSTRLRVTIDGSIANTSTGTPTLQLRYGTGAGPANSAAATGTALGNPSGYNPTSGSLLGFSKSAIITGLTPGVTVWIDLAATSNAGATTLSGLSVCVEEF